MDTIRILSTNYSGQSANITFSPATGGTEVISGITIPYDFTDDFVFGDYSVFFTAYGNTCPLNVPVPDPVLSQTGATQYENVVLSASSVLDGGTYIWTLTDFYSTGDTQISSYTGQTLIEGYFTSTGNTNVRLDVVLGSATATTTDFSVSAFAPTDVSGLVSWYDMAEVSTITFRTGTTYIEQIDDKSGNDYHLTNSTATNQPLYSASTLNGSYSAATFNGIDNWITADRGTTDTISAQTYFVMSNAKDKAGLPGVGTGNQLDGKFLILGPSITTFNTDTPYISRDNSGSDYNLKTFGDFYYTPVSNFSGETYYAYAANTNDSLGITNYAVNGETTGFTQTTGSTTYDWRYTRLGGNLHNYNDFVQKAYGEVGEVLIYDTDLPITNINIIDRYLQYKWFGSKQY